jgi:hypothetical protein
MAFVMHIHFKQEKPAQPLPSDMESPLPILKLGTLGLGVGEAVME